MKWTLDLLGTALPKIKIKQLFSTVELSLEKPSFPN